MKKVVIFTCIGGHNSISEALKEYLSTTYEVVLLNFFLDVMYYLDPLRWLTCNISNAESYYSFCMRNHFHTFLNKTHALSIKGLNLARVLIKKRLKKILQERNVDVIISVIPWFNDYFLAIAQELDIPFLLMPTDIELSHFFNNVQKVSYKKFYFLIPLPAPSVHELVTQMNIPSSNIIMSGVALKKDFFVLHNEQTIRVQFSVPLQKPVVLLLMGSQGSAAMIDYARSLSLIEDVPFHLIMVLGANTKQRTTLEKIVFGPLISCTVLDFTSYIPQLMAISTLLITKSGGISVSEALYMQLPTLLDATSEVLFWEKRNQEFMQHNRFGTAIHCLDELPEVVRAFLTTRKDMLATYKKNMQLFEKKNGAHSVKMVLDSLFVQ